MVAEGGVRGAPSSHSGDIPWVLPPLSPVLGSAGRVTSWEGIQGQGL